ncbi:hypothetical protein ACRRTK_000214 [Alexandromys fortis]
MDWVWEVSGSGLFLGHVVTWLLEEKRDQAELGEYLFACGCRMMELTPSLPSEIHMLWLKKMLDSMQYQVTFVPVGDADDSASGCRPKTIIIIIELTSPPQGL